MKRDVPLGRSKSLVRAFEVHAAETAPYLGTAGTAHDVVSAIDQKAVWVEIELKR
jgi:hypothetical protein